MESETPVASDAKYADKADESAATSRALLLSGGLLGTCIVFLASLLSLPHVDVWLTIALYAFVIAMPCLGYVIAAITMSEKTHPLDVSDDVRGMFIRGLNAAHSLPQTLAAEIGSAAAIVGIMAVVGHLSVLAFIVFIVTILGILALYLRAYTSTRVPPR